LTLLIALKRTNKTKEKITYETQHRNFYHQKFHLSTITSSVSYLRKLQVFFW